MAKVFIDGSAGTTGLRIYERLGQRADIELITLAEDVRKDTAARADAINSADVVFLCLPDAAAAEAVTLCKNENTVIIDTSTAHRTNENWTYGFPELTGQREKIKTSKRVANPGCHASGFIALVAPLVENGLLSPDALLSCFSLTGYSGGGKKMIADYLAPEAAGVLDAPRMYGISQAHKHLPEMMKVCGLKNAPVFAPVVSSYYSGMQSTVPLFGDQIKTDMNGLRELYKQYYKGSSVIRFSDADESGFLSASALSGLDGMTVGVFGNDERMTLVARFDNLGKGASGAAIQNMNIVLGTEETTGLVLGGK